MSIEYANLTKINLNIATTCYTQINLFVLIPFSITVIQNNGQFALIDAGDCDDDAKVKSYLKNQRVTRLEYLIITHFHADHFGDAESLRFDFSKSPEIKNVKTCDVSLAVVDGMGKEYPNELKLRDAYTQITDLTTSKSLKVEGDIIKNVVLNKGVAQLKLQSSDNNLNKNLKFVYYVEV